MIDLPLAVGLFAVGVVVGWGARARRDPVARADTAPTASRWECACGRTFPTAGAAVDHARDDHDAYDDADAQLLVEEVADA